MITRHWARGSDAGAWLGFQAGPGLRREPGGSRLRLPPGSPPPAGLAPWCQFEGAPLGRGCWAARVYLAEHFPGLVPACGLATVQPGVGGPRMAATRAPGRVATRCRAPAGDAEVLISLDAVTGPAVPVVGGRAGRPMRTSPGPASAWRLAWGRDRPVPGRPATAAPPEPYQSSRRITSSAPSARRRRLPVCR